MCGLAGELRFDGTPPSREAIATMVASMRDRGPDGEGITIGPRVALGHRRLAIIDPTDRSAQPLSDLGLTIVYNGALYEYRAIRQRLEGLGYHFASDGDTEVVLKAYHAWGTSCVEHLRGMFAFAIADAAGRAFLARDRFGIKPLYWTAGPGHFRFASTLPALLAAGDVDTSLDAAAVQQFCTLHGIVAAPRTLLAGVRKLPPATWMAIETDGTRREHTYWTMRREPDPGPSPAQWHAQLRAALATAVQRRLVADTDVGVLLSGGLDSSLIVALLAEGGARDIPTFSIGFESAHGEPGDEFRWSDAVAARFGTEHRRIEVGAAETLAALEGSIAAMSEPMVSHDNIGFFLLGQRVRARAKVVQCGQGADEIFGGYHWYAALQGQSGADAYGRLFFDRSLAEYQQLVTAEFGDGDAVRSLVEPYFPSGRSAVDGALEIDAGTMLPGDPIPRLDNMMMASGIEARVPFLDDDVVDIARRIPAALTVPGGKATLKAVARTLLPPELVDRPKGYFPVPALRWLDGEILRRVTGWLTTPRARARGVFRARAIDALLATPHQHLTPLGGSTLWQVAVLEAWLTARGL